MLSNESIVKIDQSLFSIRCLTASAQLAWILRRSILLLEQGQWRRLESLKANRELYEFSEGAKMTKQPKSVVLTRNNDDMKKLLEHFHDMRQEFDTCIKFRSSHIETSPGENENLFATLTVSTYVWIVINWTFQQSLGKSTERRVWHVSHLGETQGLVWYAICCT